MDLKANIHIYIVILLIDYGLSSTKSVCFNFYSRLNLKINATYGRGLLGKRKTGSVVKQFYTSHYNPFRPNKIYRLLSVELVHTVLEFVVWKE